ncbi:hypothetical protein Tco_0295831 [Tanacetum coccineum]
MADKETKSTMREFTTNDRANYYSGITSITVNGKNTYELKGKFLDDLHKNAFSGSKGEDAVEHVEYFLRIVDPIDLPYVNQDKLRVVVFPISMKLGSDEIEPTDEKFLNLKEYRVRGDDEVELTDEESSNSDDEDEESRLIYLTSRHLCKDDGYCNRGNLLIGNILRYQDLEWYEALKDGKLKEEALKNKAIMEGMIGEDDESSNEGWRRWGNFNNTNRDNERSENVMKKEDEERYDVFDDHEPSICNIGRFEMIKYSFRDGEEYVAIKENEYDDLTNTRMEAIHAYQEIFRMMDGGWMVTRTE